MGRSNEAQVKWLKELASMGRRERETGPLY